MIIGWWIKGLNNNVKISKDVTVHATDMLLHFVVKWEGSTPEGNADLFFKGNQLIFFKPVCGYRSNLSKYCL